MSSDPPRPLHDAAGQTPSVDAALITSQPDPDPSATASLGARTMDGDPPLQPVSGVSFGRYTLLAELGQGGMGTVFKAWDPMLDRPVALKVLHAGRLAGESATRRFLNEARAVARLDHPNIVEIHDMGLADEAPYFTMALVDGPNLARWVTRRDTPPDGRLLCALLAPVARALAHAHRAGIIHRDVKPGNVIVGADGAARLVDFGVARLVDTDLTRTGHVVGTPAFMPPEQARGEADIDHRVDVFGLGAVLYWALNRRMPPRGGPPSVPGASRDLEAICLEALAPERAARYPDCDALAADLERCARGEPVLAARPGPSRRLRWWLRRRRVAVFAVGGLALGLIGGQWIVRTVADRRAAAERASIERAADERLSRAGGQISLLLADGRADEAEEVRDAAVGRLDVQGTPALARFHLAEGRRGLEERAPEAADAFAAAYVQTDRADLRRNALLGLGQYHRVLAERVELRAVLAAVERTLPEALDDPAFTSLRRDAALLERDLETAAALSPPAAADTLRALSRHLRPALPTVPRSVVSAGLIQPSEELMQAMGLEPGPLVQIGFDLARPTPELPPVGRIPEPPDARWLEAPRIFADPEGRTVLLGRIRPSGREAAVAALYRWSTLDGPLIELWRDPSITSLRRPRQLDLDGDGRAPIWFAPLWSFEALIPTGGDRWRRVTPDPQLARAGSIAYGITGVSTATGPALAVALGEWRAYDLRLLAPSPDESRLKRVGRLKLGHLVGLAADREPGELWALTDGTSLNPRMFTVQPTTPTLYRIRVDGQGPAVTARIPLPPMLEGVSRRLIPFRPIAGGPLVFAFHMHGSPWGTGLVVDARGPAPSALILADLEPLLAADLDGDGDDELVVRGRDEGPVMVLGARSTERLAPLSVGHGPRGEPREQSIPGLPAIERAIVGMPSDDMDPIDDLVVLGRLRTARDQLRLRAGTGRARVRSRLRAGALSLRIDDPAGAASDFSDAADGASDPAIARVARQAAADAHRRLRQPEAERTALAALADISPPVDRRLVEQRIAALSERRTHRIDFTAPLAPGWRFTLPERLRRDARRGRLLIDARMHDGELATLNLKPERGRVQIGGSIALDRAEQSSTLVIGLSRLVAGRPRSASLGAHPEAGLMIAHNGVSGEGRLSIFATSGQQQRLLVHTPEKSLARHEPTRFRVELHGGAGEAFVEWGEGPAARRSIFRIAPNTADVQAVALTLGTHRLPGGGDGALRARLGPIEVTGAGLSSTEAQEPAAERALAAAHHAIVQGEPDRAEAAFRAVLGSADALPPLENAIALDDASRLAEAEMALGQIPAGPRRDRLLVGWLHQRPGQTFDRIERLWGLDEALRLFLGAWGSTISFHPRDAEGREALALIESRFDVGSVGADDARRQLAVQLLGRVANSSAALGRVRRARRAFDALLALMPADVAPIVEDRIVGWMLMRAELEAEHGTPGSARLWLERALERSGVPELVMDHIRASASLSSLLPLDAADER